MNGNPPSHPTPFREEFRGELWRVIATFSCGTFCWLGLMSKDPCGAWPFGWRLIYWSLLVVGGFLGGIGNWNSIIIGPIYMTAGHLLGAGMQATICGLNSRSPWLIPYWIFMLAVPILIAVPTSLAGHLAWCVTTDSSPFQSRSPPTANPSHHLK